MWHAQAAASRDQDERHGEQQGQLEKQMADLKLRASKFGTESSEVSDSLRKKRLKLQQDVEVSYCSSPNAGTVNVDYSDCACMDNAGMGFAASQL